MQSERDPWREIAQQRRELGRLRDEIEELRRKQAEQSAELIRMQKRMMERAPVYLGPEQSIWIDQDGKWHHEVRKPEPATVYVEPYDFHVPPWI